MDVVLGARPKHIDNLSSCAPANTLLWNTYDHLHDARHRRIDKLSSCAIANALQGSIHDHLTDVLTLHRDVARALECLTPQGCTS